MHDGFLLLYPALEMVNFEETILLCDDPASLRARVASYPAPLNRFHLIKK
jgi:hypothetical protein